MEKYSSGRRGRFAKSLDVKACQGSNPCFSATICPKTRLNSGFSAIYGLKNELFCPSN